MPRRTLKAGRKGTKKRKRSSRKRKGGNVLVNAAVPASLIYALNKKYGKKKGGRSGSRKRGSRKRRRRRGKRRHGGNADKHTD